MWRGDESGPGPPPWVRGSGPWAGGDAPWAGGPPAPVRWVLALVLAFVQVAGSVGASHAQPDARGVDVLAVLLLLGAPLSLGLLGRLPWLAAPLTATTTAAYLLAGYPFGPVFLGLAVVLVVTVVRGRRVAAWASAAVVLAAAATRLLPAAGGPNWQGAGGLLAWTLVVLAVGEVVRVRRDRAQGLRQAALERRRREAGEERLRIAQELHDVVAHHMSLINVQAGVALHLAERRPETVEPALRAIKEASREALGELRSLVDVLRDDSPAPRAPAPTLAGLDDVVARAGLAGLEVTKSVAGHERPLPTAVELAAYRVVQEAVTNVVRHAHAGRARVHLDYGADVLTVTVEDDGTGGPRAASVQRGNGLRGMQERATALGGSLEVGPSPWGGLTVVARLPVEGP